MAGWGTSCHGGEPADELQRELSRNAEKPLEVEFSDITNDRGIGAMLADAAALDGKLLAKFRPSILKGTALISSGLLWITGAD